MSKTYPLMLAVDCGFDDCAARDCQPGESGSPDSLTTSSSLVVPPSLMVGSSVCWALIVPARPRKEIHTTRLRKICRYWGKFPFFL